jgi:crotonobetainyl-CoA:carnitine CoA-transferase CaiB-like acyl-CoA transferase
LKNDGKKALEPYRVLDLTDAKGLLAGKIFADLGADVIKVEPPGGDPARRVGPFCGDDLDPEKSLFWMAYNTGKRGITLDIVKEEDRKILKRLVTKADFLIEVESGTDHGFHYSFWPDRPPCPLERTGYYSLGYGGLHVDDG